MKRVYRLEGWRGLLKGIVPVSLMTVTRVTIIGSLPPLNPVLAICRSAIFFIPEMTLESRTVTAREMLPFFDVRRAIPVLFSRPERRQPWLLYLTPGVVPVTLLQLACGHLVAQIQDAVTSLVVDREISYGVSTLTLVRLGCVILRTAMTTPLQVIAVRLAIQRNRSPVSLGKNRLSINGSEKLAERLTTEEQVLHLRTDLDLPPYTGMWDCARCIIKEEGLWVLYRTSCMLFLSMS
ncbi:hypothetical protein PAXRUDRAFT_829263 [Paxillus rubicundulus Ve08.2h10]|uniref:Uncharacterized protein n=1 Tax=Paxillus rubicundulus Ve08.2h10 TaxID=930991 RepID=A0A0D0D840_9AGAM|nr:hypothetical protein PAXRUDRAFT_829263 [Paxillus rubicundulus Ve08.2h10]